MAWTTDPISTYRNKDIEVKMNDGAECRGKLAGYNDIGVLVEVTGGPSRFIPYSNVRIIYELQKAQT